MIVFRMIQDYIETYIGEDSKRGEPLDAVKEIENSTDVRVSYFSSKLNFALETFHRVGGSGNLGANRL